MSSTKKSGKKKSSSNSSNPVYSDSSSSSNQKREYENEMSEAEQKKKKSRWQGSEHEKAFIPGMPTILPSNMQKDQEEAYLMQLQIEELSHRLRSNDLGIPPNPEDRSPSPEPVYNNWGKRVNTRVVRTRKKLEDERDALIQKMLKINTDYKPPAEYKPPYVKILSEKLFIPQEDHPDINFLGLLIGPRGNTLRAMEKDSGARIIVRGKGSVKEGKVNRNDGGPMPGEDEPLHAYITAPSYDSIEKAVGLINAIIHQCVAIPDGQDDWRKKQLRELAVLNGTLRETAGITCTNCGSNAHKSWMCPDRVNVTNSVLCANCGSAGHIAKDCKQRKKFVPSSSQALNSQKIDEEYMSLMAELGEGSSKGGAIGNRMQGGASAFRGLFSTREAPRAIAGPQLPEAQGAAYNGSNPSSASDWNQSYSNWYGNPNQGTNSHNDGGGANQNQSQNYNQQSSVYWQNQGQQGAVYQSSQNEPQYSQGYQSATAYNQQSASPTAYNQGSQQQLHYQHQQPVQHQYQQPQQQQQQSWMTQSSGYGSSSWQGGSHGPYGWDTEPSQ